MHISILRRNIRVIKPKKEKYKEYRVYCPEHPINTHISSYSCLCLAVPHTAVQGTLVTNGPLVQCKHTV